MDWGLKNRLARMIKPSDGRSVMLACDHGYFMGPTRRLEVPRRTFGPLVPYADALSVTRGILRTSVDPAWEVPILLRVSGGTSVLQEDLSDEGLTAGHEDGADVNASAVPYRSSSARAREADAPELGEAGRRRRGAGHARHGNHGGRKGTREAGRKVPTCSPAESRQRSGPTS